ncbi:hypothetical protein [Caudoviricetes sp.]|nr:hypothetical protein [Caudoviricetes sp.]
MKNLNLNTILICAVLFFVSLHLGVSFAAPGDRAAPLDALMRTLNGQPVKVGTLESSGSSVNNATTASTFSVGEGKVVMFVCNGAANVNIGADSCSASSTITASDFGRPLDTSEKWYETLPPNQSCVAMIGASGTKCAVFEMR